MTGNMFRVVCPPCRSRSVHREQESHGWTRVDKCGHGIDLLNHAWTKVDKRGQTWTWD